MAVTTSRTETRTAHRPHDAVKAFNAAFQRYGQAIRADLVSISDERTASGRYRYVVQFTEVRDEDGRVVFGPPPPSDADRGIVPAWVAANGYDLIEQTPDYLILGKGNLTPDALGAVFYRITATTHEGGYLPVRVECNVQWTKGFSQPHVGIGPSTHTADILSLRAYADVLRHTATILQHVKDNQS